MSSARWRGACLQFQYSGRTLNWSPVWSILWVSEQPLYADLVSKKHQKESVSSMAFSVVMVVLNFKLFLRTQLTFHFTLIIQPKFLCFCLTVSKVLYYTWKHVCRTWAVAQWWKTALHWLILSIIVWVELSRNVILATDLLQHLCFSTVGGIEISQNCNIRGHL